jgi:hypothetical protein
LFDGFGIDGNRRIFEDLVALLKKGKAIGFVGAGASAPLYPLWTDLIARLATRAPVDERKRAFWREQAGAQPAAIAKQIRRAFDRGTFNQAILEIFGPQAGQADTSTHRALVSLPFNTFVTTNYDSGLDRAHSALRLPRVATPFTWQDDRVSFWDREE